MTLGSTYHTVVPRAQVATGKQNRLPGAFLGLGAVTVVGIVVVILSRQSHDRLRRPVAASPNMSPSERLEAAKVAAMAAAAEEVRAAEEAARAITPELSRLLGEVADMEEEGIGLHHKVMRLEAAVAKRMAKAACVPNAYRLPHAYAV